VVPPKAEQPAIPAVVQSKQAGNRKAVEAPQQVQLTREEHVPPLADPEILNAISKLRDLAVIAIARSRKSKTDNSGQSQGMNPGGGLVPAL